MLPVVFPAPADSASFGSVVTSLGDVDGDGENDIAFGAPEDAPKGRVFLWLSRRPGLLELLPPSGVTDGALFSTLIFSIDLTVDEVLAVLVVFIGDRAPTAYSVPRPGHGTIADAEFFQRQRRWQPIGEHLCQPPGGEQPMYDDAVFQARLNGEMVIIMDLIVIA